MNNHDINYVNNSPLVSKKNILMKVFFVIFIAVLICYLVYMQILQSKLMVMQGYQDEKLALVNTEFARELSSIKKLTKILANNNNLKRGSSSRFEYRDPQSLKKINKYFLDFGLMSPNISQIRWIDIVGNERFRINFKDGQAQVVKPENLQNKMSRYYFRQGIAINSPDSFLSKIDLNMEYGAITTPIEPTIRVTHRTSENDYIVDGLIVINFNLTEFFKKIRDISSKDNQINIINSSSHWLFNNDPSKEWGIILKKPHYNLKNMNPKLWQILTSQSDHTIRYLDTDMYTIGKLPVLYSKKHKEALNETIYVYIKSGEQAIARVSLSAFLYASVCAFGFIIISTFFLYREHRSNNTINNLFDALKTEKIELKHVNKTLSKTIKQQQLLQKNLIEAQRLSSLGLLVAGVAHEMNTPIGGAIISVSNAESVIKRLSESIKIGLTKSQLENDTYSIKDNLELAKVNLDKAAVIVKSFKKMAIDRNNEDFIDCDLKDVINDLLIAFHSRLKNSKINVKTQFIGNINIKTRPGIISQVIENLVMNAFNHAFIKNQKGEIEIKAINVDKKIKIIISDTGIGINKEKQISIFEPFYTTARGEGNTGLGLFMVMQWVTQILNAKLELDSNPESTEKFKTRFTITFPTD
ncbi:MULTISPECIES: sensor histidine kinase [unclassified Pseudoalteromonas]|uniref:sensor histidine kinase n=1 Tax=unclassified Pseudoalteromonas TaxID=194690 RepID=UPI000CBC1E2D|nr:MULTISPECIES: HAMP domain-containing sensor histidine kinase [unclassified Pseudoalteromonas]MBH0046287.1 sensor histidine kinase [Pseudoalteromonas sp. NZS11_1]PLT23908.1 sensor histidine kinase [Pseudoalteromonas sp. MelDa3]